MPHILFITPYYLPERGAAAVQMSETATRLARLGYQVTVLTTFPNYPTGIVLPAYRGYRIKREFLDGVYVVRVWSYTSPNKNFFHRMLSQLSFGCLAPLLGWWHIGQPDLIIVQSPPLFDAIAVRVLARLKHIPYIFMVSDLWPEVAVQLGVLRNRFLIWLAQWLEWSSYQRAGLVWSLTEGIQNTLIKRGLAPERIFFLANGVDVTKFSPMPRDSARAELGWGNYFTVLYAGTHGLVYALEALIDAAEQLRNYPDIRIILVGAGVTKAGLMQQAQKRQLENVVFLDAVPYERMPLLQAASDVCVIPVRNMPMATSTLPTKMFEIMASARPILLGLDGEARRLAEQEAGAAIYVEPENADALVSQILYLYEHPEVAEALGQRGRAFVELHYDRDEQMHILDERITSLLVKKSAPVLPATPSPLKKTGEITHV